jgi:hypothetical protein
MAAATIKHRVIQSPGDMYEADHVTLQHDNTLICRWAFKLNSSWKHPRFISNTVLGQTLIFHTHRSVLCYIVHLHAINFNCN